MAPARYTRMPQFNSIGAIGRRRDSLPDLRPDSNISLLETGGVAPRSAASANAHGGRATPGGEDMSRRSASRQVLQRRGGFALAAAAFAAAVSAAACRSGGGHGERGAR